MTDRCLKSAVKGLRVPYSNGTLEIQPCFCGQVQLRAGGRTVMFKSTWRVGHPPGATAVLQCTDVAVVRGKELRAHLLCLTHLICTAKFGIQIVMYGALELRCGLQHQAPVLISGA